MLKYILLIQLLGILVCTDEKIPPVNPLSYEMDWKIYTLERPAPFDPLRHNE